MYYNVMQPIKYPFHDTDLLTGVFQGVDFQNFKIQN